MRPAGISAFRRRLESLVDLELEARNARSIERRFRLSRLQAQHSIDSFNFKHHKSRAELKTRILRLLDLDFLQKGTNAIFIGNPGVGKTSLAKIVGWKACKANQRVLFTTAMDMLNHLLASQVNHSLIRRLKIYTEPTLLISDELGYLSLDQQTSTFFYQVISTRQSHKRSTIITTNTALHTKLNQVSGASRSKYHDLDLGLSDASVVAAAERIGTDRILTVDSRDSRAIRSARGIVLPAAPRGTAEEVSRSLFVARDSFSPPTLMGAHPSEQ
jgi:DNA replication protein DnaC